MKDPKTTSWCRAVARALFRSLGLRDRGERRGSGVETRSFAPTRPQLPAGPLPAADPSARAVPLRVDALREALQTRPGLREQHGHLTLLEFACATSGDDPFSRLPPRTLDVAIRQLEQAARVSPTLDVLRLQLDRHLQERRSRVEALLAEGDAALRSLAVKPLTAGNLAQDLAQHSAQHGAQDRSEPTTPVWRDTVFMDTEPMEIGPYHRDFD